MEGSGERSVVCLLSICMCSYKVYCLLSLRYGLNGVHMWILITICSVTAVSRFTDEEAEALGHSPVKRRSQDLILLCILPHSDGLLQAYLLKAAVFNQCVARIF